MQRVEPICNGAVSMNGLVVEYVGCVVQSRQGGRMLEEWITLATNKNGMGNVGDYTEILWLSVGLVLTHQQNQRVAVRD